MMMMIDVIICNNTDVSDDKWLNFYAAVLYSSAKPLICLKTSSNGRLSKRVSALKCEVCGGRSTAV
jgi:hypothetical protein